MSIFARFSSATSKSDAPSPPPSSSSSQSREYSDAAKQRELTVELARLLARRPVMQRTAAKQPCCEFDETDEVEEEVDVAPAGLEIGTGDSETKTGIGVGPSSLSLPPLPGAFAATTAPSTDDHASLPASHDASGLSGQEAGDAAPRNPDHARWVKTSRRARFNSGARKAASWMISIFTGVFIFAIVALIVLGPPKDYDKLIDWPSKSIALSSTDAIPSKTTRAASELETRSVKIHQFRLSQDDSANAGAAQGR